MLINSSEALARLQEQNILTDRKLEEKAHEMAQLTTQLETVREESARQVARTKDRCDTVRRSLQCQLGDLERQLAQSRAAARTALKDRDEVSLGETTPLFNSLHYYL